VRPAPLVRSLLAAAVLLAARPVLACSLCTCGDPLLEAGDAAPTEREVRLSLETEWLTARMGMEDAPGTDERLEQYTVRVGAVASPLPRLNALVLLPLVRKDISEHGGGASGATETFTGIGDVEIGARWFLLDRTSFSALRHQSFALSSGTSLPTGPNDAKEDGLRVDEHAQLGTGAYGPYAGVLWRLTQTRWHAAASLTARYRTENGFHYRYGASLGWTVQAQLQATPRLAAGLSLDGRDAAADEEEGVRVPNTGGLVLAITPSLNVDVGRGVWLQVRAQLPVATRLLGDQDVGPVVSAGVQLRVL
jgi:hypothetical protein